MRLSKRLLGIAGMVSKGFKAADVGCDHAHLAIYLAENSICPYVYATDINRGPLLRADEEIKKYGLEDRIETILSDGLKGLLVKDPEAVIIAGMGASTMVDILKSGEDVLTRIKELILEPQSEPWLLRHFLNDSGFSIIAEALILEDGKYYPVIKCVHGRMDLEREVFFRYGKLPVKEKDPILFEYLDRQKKTFSEIIDELSSMERTESITSRLISLKKEYGYVEEALFLMGR